MKTLGHRALFGKGLAAKTIEKNLAPYHREEVVLVLTTLAALLAHDEVEDTAHQRALVHTFFLESAAKVEPKVKRGAVVFHHAQVLATLRLAMAHCAGDRGSQPTGTAFFEGVARLLAAVTDHLAPPKPPALGRDASTHEHLVAHLDHLIRCEGPRALDIPAEVLRAHHLLFERGSKIASRGDHVNLRGAFHERHGIRCDRWFALTLHLLAKSLDYSLATMHQRQPVVRILSDLRASPLEARQIERLFTPLSTGLRRAGERVRASLEEGTGLGDFEALRLRPILHMLEDTYAATDPHLLCEAIAGDLGTRLIAAAGNPRAAAATWTALVREHTQRLLPPLTASLTKAERTYRGECPIGDWFACRGADMLLVWVAPTPLRRDPRGDLAEGCVHALLGALRRTRDLLDAWGNERCAPGGKKLSQIKRIFPLAVLERDIPQDATLHRLLAKLAKEEELDLPRVQPLATIDLELLEALAGTPKPPPLLPLIAKRAAATSKSQSLRVFAERQGLPTRPDPDVTRPAFEKLVKRERKLLGVK